jgi:tungstate transport system substrate-binding protein
MRFLLYLILCYFLIHLVAATATAGSQLRIAAPAEVTGLLAIIVPRFEQKDGCKVELTVAPENEAVKLGETGKVDLMIGNDRELAERFVSQGFGLSIRNLMYNDFLLLGPSGDPAGVKRSKSMTGALRAVASLPATFVSRGDGSGTNRKELELWQSAGVRPAGSWYKEAGKGMEEVIRMAERLNGYTLADRGSYNAIKGTQGLKVVFSGEKGLFNPYVVVDVNPARIKGINRDLAVRFMDYLTSPAIRRTIAEYRVNNEPLFYLYDRQQ